MTPRVRDLTYHLNYWPAQNAEPAMTLWMCHGWMDVGASFQFVVDCLPADWAVYAPDWRGFGRTAHVDADSYWFYDYLGDLDNLADQYSADRPLNLVGHSMGGNVCTLFSGVRADRVRRLVNLEGMGLHKADPSKAPTRIGQWLDELQRPQQFAPYKSFAHVAERLMKINPRLSADKAHFMASHWAQADDDGKVRLISDPQHKVVNPYQYRLDETLAIWESITAPMLLVISEHRDRWHAFTQTQEYRDRLAHIKTLEHTEVADAGHMMHHDQPQVVADLIVRFMS